MNSIFRYGNMSIPSKRKTRYTDWLWPDSSSSTISRLIRRRSTVIISKRTYPSRKKIPGLRAYSVNSGKVTMVTGSVSPHMIAELDFDSMAALDAAMASPEGQAAAADLPNFAQAGATLLVFETRTL